MRHKLSGSNLGRTSSHRAALMRNMAGSLISNGGIETTLPKAKQLKSYADKLVTLGKKNNLVSKRRALTLLFDRSAMSKLFDDVAPKYVDRNGGYTRIIKLGKRRVGDCAEMARIEFV